MSYDPRSYPLAWPPQLPRSRYQAESAFGREAGHRRTLAGHLLDLRREMRLLPVDVGSLVVSSNLRIKADGMPYSKQSELEGAPGIAVYWTKGERPYVLACDRYKRAGCNMRAIVLHVKALRGIGRWGCGDLEQAFAGYAALPPGRTWWATLGLEVAPVCQATVHAAYKRQAMQRHPDQGGTRAEWDELQLALQQGLEGTVA
jgi:hypothetical protein